jgi:uncharacterized membrane protein (DUF4010 family)
MEMKEVLQAFIVAILIGLIVGIERERSQEPKLTTMGVRTFTLLAILGGMVAIIDNIALKLVITFFALYGIWLAYWRSTQMKQNQSISIGITTEFSAGIVFCLGYLAHQSLFLAITLACLLLAILVSRETLHKFSRNTVSSQEIYATTILLVFLFGFLPFLPNQAIDPWSLINPHRIGSIIVLLSALQVTGYIAVRIFGNRLGLALNSFFGGFVSSTSVFMNLAKIHKNSPQLFRACIAGASLTTSASLIQSMFILYLLTPTIANTLFLPLFVMIIIGIATGILILKNGHQHHTLGVENNPLDLKSVFKNALILSIMIASVTLMNHYLGNQGLNISSFLGGIIDSHSVLFANTNLFLQHKITEQNTINAICFAVSASLISKLIIVALSGKKSLIFSMAAIILSMLISGAVIFFLM